MNRRRPEGTPKGEKNRCIPLSYSIIFRIHETPETFLRPMLSLKLKIPLAAMYCG